MGKLCESSLFAHLMLVDYEQKQRDDQQMIWTGYKWENSETAPRIEHYRDSYQRSIRVVWIER